MEKEINKEEMFHIGGTIYSCSFDAKYVNDIRNENGERLKFCYNIGMKILSVLDFKKEFNKLTIKYE